MLEKSLSSMIRDTRQKLGISQKDLAKSINEKPIVINQYENGTAIPNNQIIQRLENALNVFLRGKKKGEPKKKIDNQKNKCYFKYFIKLNSSSKSNLLFFSFIEVKDPLDSYT